MSQNINPSELSAQQISDLSVQQLKNLLWQFKGTPAATPLYRELATRPPRATFSSNDPDWEEKFSASLAQFLQEAEANG
jgi:hypothetical protein